MLYLAVRYMIFYLICTTAYRKLLLIICLLQMYIFMFKNITLSVPGAVVTGIICILLLFLLKFISEKLKDKMKFPLPAELIVVSKKYFVLNAGVTLCLMSTFNIVLYLSSGLENVIVFVKELAIIIISLRDISV